MLENTLCILQHIQEQRKILPKIMLMLCPVSVILKIRPRESSTKAACDQSILLLTLSCLA